MVCDHTKLSIAQIVFYLPVVITSAYLACYRHGRPRMAWIILMIFSSIRIAAGIVVIVYEQVPRTGLMVSSLILLNAGVFPLIAATLGFIRIIYGFTFYGFENLTTSSISLEKSMNPRIRQCLLLSRILFFAGIGLTIAGGVLEGSDSIDDVITGNKLVKTGYILVVVFVACLLVIQAYFWTQKSRLARTSRMILTSTTIAIPFIATRITYLFLSVFHVSDLRWSALLGPVAPFLLMGLVMEYSVVCVYLTTGFLIPCLKAVKV
ncbi:hypothetical protein N7462_003122 [Penicillium macrosclerotiorum]|uniref:uncharacterized protein n=1 Tax=Penicillium macrosclerotiorum TaxID=303699 RepID=UPI0025465916|nr:uncharacterized protein N7462_003122 [Penicillium macrosclerotiorum]KAJ5688730.1 hypothetical protein N7462_003122 [Penicillium macrosclerotiorum]